MFMHFWLRVSPMNVCVWVVVGVSIKRNETNYRSSADMSHGLTSPSDYGFSHMMTSPSDSVLDVDFEFDENNMLPCSVPAAHKSPDKKRMRRRGHSAHNSPTGPLRRGNSHSDSSFMELEQAFKEYDV